MVKYRLSLMRIVIILFFSFLFFSGSISCYDPISNLKSESIIYCFRQVKKKKFILGFALNAPKTLRIHSFGTHSPHISPISETKTDPLFVRLCFSRRSTKAGLNPCVLYGSTPLVASFSANLLAQQYRQLCRHPVTGFHVFNRKLSLTIYSNR